MKKIIHYFTFLLSAVLGTINAQTDASFGTLGRLLLPSESNTVFQLRRLKTDAAGAIYTYGNALAGQESDVVLQKLTPSGSMDLNFGIGGRKKIHLNLKDYAADLLFLPHQKILLAGYTIENGANKVFTAQLDAQGAPVGTTVAVNHPLMASDVVITAAALTSRAQYLLTGYGTNPSTGNQDFLLLLVGKDGQLVPTFGNAGLRWIDFGGGDDLAQHILVRRDGSILLTGSSQSNSKEQYALASLNSNGELIASFGVLGKLLVSVGTSGLDRAYEAYAQDNGKIIVAGYSKHGTRDVISLINIASATGQLDRQFDLDGKRVIYVAGKNDRAYGVVGTQDGALYVAGMSQQYNNVYHPILIKIKADGSYDTAFGNAGVLRVPHSINGEPLGHGVAVQGFTKPLLALTGSTSQEILLVRAVEAKPNLAYFSIQAKAPVCEGLVQLIPKNAEGTHQWIFEEPYGPANSSETSPSVKFWKAGYHKIKHLYTTLEGVQHLLEQVVFVDKSPAAYTNQYDIVPYAWPTIVFGHSEKNFYTSEGNTFAYSWEHLGNIYENVGSIQQTYPEAGFYPLTFKVTRQATYEDLCPTAYVHDTIIATNSRENCSEDDASGSPQVVYNLVVNGDFEENTCPSVSFKSDFEQQCLSLQTITPEKIAIVTSENGSKVLRQQEKEYDFDPFLLIGKYSHIQNRDLWSQEVQVQEGKEYLFYAEFLNRSYELEGDYTFPKLTFAVDETPLLTRELVTGVRSMCYSYRASATGKIRLRILKSNGVYFSDGNIEVDNIVFGPSLEEAGLRKDLVQNSIAEQITISPNPATSFFDIYLGEHSGRAVLYNTMGAVVKQQDLAAMNTQVGLADIESGIYIVKIYNESSALLKSQLLVVKK